jgi:hypothetical protein
MVIDVDCRHPDLVEPRSQPMRCARRSQCPSDERPVIREIQAIQEIDKQKRGAIAPLLSRRAGLTHFSDDRPRKDHTTAREGRSSDGT